MAPKQSKESKETPTVKEAPMSKKALKQQEIEAAAKALADEAAKKAKNGEQSNMITQLKNQAPLHQDAADTLEVYKGLSMKDDEKTRILEKWMKALCCRACVCLF
jgi:hypothetical protein